MPNRRQSVQSWKERRNEMWPPCTPQHWFCVISEDTKFKLPARSSKHFWSQFLDSWVPCSSSALPRDPRACRADVICFVLLSCNNIWHVFSNYLAAGSSLRLRLLIPQKSMEIRTRCFTHPDGRHFHGLDTQQSDTLLQQSRGSSNRDLCY